MTRAGRLRGEAPLTPEGFRRASGVSRETLARLEVYAELLRRWQRRINLVGARSLEDLWRRHLLDSAQLLPLVPPGARRLLDLGSGAGFPGLVLAIMGTPGVELVESDARKCAFLAEAARATATEVGITRARIEAYDGPPADVVVARALAPLERLLAYAAPLLAPEGVALFLKGAGADRELTAARERWTMTVRRIPSLSDPTGVILEIRNIRRADAE